MVTGCDWEEVRGQVSCCSCCAGGSDILTEERMQEKPVHTR